MQTNTERTRAFRAARKKADSERQINLWLPVRVLGALDGLIGKRGANRKEVVVDLIEKASK